MRKLTIFILLFTLLLSMVSVIPAKVDGAVDYSKYSNKKYEWDVNCVKNHQYIDGKVPDKVLKKYNTYVTAFPKEGDKVVYLTFDAGYESYHVAKILDILKKYKIKTTFFVTGEYIREKNNKIRRMKKEGHVVGNHTLSHSFSSKRSVSWIKDDIKSCAALMKKRTGYKMDMFFRPPCGDFSKRSLKIADDLGYTNFLWSYSYYDYNEYDQPSYKSVINGFKKNHYNGMIALIHVNSSANIKALPHVIEYLKSKGYRFGSLNELKPRNK